MPLSSEGVTPPTSSAPMAMASNTTTLCRVLYERRLVLWVPHRPHDPDRTWRAGMRTDSGPNGPSGRPPSRGRDDIYAAQSIIRPCADIRVNH